MEREVAALIELASGRGDNAIGILQAAASAENDLPAPLGLPAPVKPAPELLGEVLLEVGRPREAVEPFERTLQRHGNRSLSVLGLARAATALGDAGEAGRRYRELLANFDGADADLPELAEARSALAQLERPKPRLLTGVPVWLTVGGLAVAALGLSAGLTWRARRRPSEIPKRVTTRTRKHKKT
jgi:tetratricopeptide (TPR) repeat protein